MEQGILERIETKLDALTEAFEKAGFAAQQITATTMPALPDADNAVKQSEVPPAPAPTAEKTPTATPVDTNVELDTDGVPWDERIHSSNKKRSKGGKGAWMKRKMVDKDEYARITAELREKYSATSGAKQPHTVDGEAQSVTPPAPPAATKSTPPPPAPAGSATPPPPAPAGAAPATAAEVPSRSKAIEAVNDITKKFGLNYDAVIQYFVDNYNVAGFDQVPPDKFDFVVEDVTTWSATLSEIGTKVADIKKVYVNDVSVIEPYINQCWAAATLNDAPCANYTDVPFDQLDKVLTPLNNLHAQCAAVEG